MRTIGELERLGAVARALDAALDAHRNGAAIEETTMFEGFAPSAYDEEARERWGHTEAYRESKRRTDGYSEAEWAEIKAQSDEIEVALAAALRSREPADGETACAAAEAHRRHISRWFYDCPPEIHRRLGELYVADPRFAAHYEQRAPGLAAYARDAIAANAAEGV